MHEIDKARFGSFLSELRREKGLTQKELAGKLYVSDKAVSKWETGVNIPDTSMLIPLSEILDVSVTELLMCERLSDSDSLSHDVVEDTVKTAITYSDTDLRAWHTAGRWAYIYPCALMLGIAGSCMTYILKASPLTVYTVAILAAIFGAYFCFFVQTKLPSYYDDNKISGVYDSPFRMNVPGLYFNNSNWPYIVLVGKIWSCAALAFYPAMNIVFSRFFPLFWTRAELFVCLVITLGGLFVPIYAVGKKYE